MSTVNSMKKIAFYTSNYHDQELRNLSVEKKIPVSRLVALAVDNEMMRDKPFDFESELTYPIFGEYEEYAYADEGGKLLTFMKTLNKGAGLDMILLWRFEIGVPDKNALLTAFSEALHNGMIEAYKPPQRAGRSPFPDDYFYYRIPVKKGHETARKRKNRASEYEQYLKLKKKFGSEA